MFRKLDQYLLTRYPLLWNMRMHILAPLILVLHLLFFCLGYMRHTTLHSLAGDYYDMRTMDTMQVMGALLAVLIMVIWLVFYLRNNAFKSFYPLKKGRLFAEFLLTALILFSVSTFALSWQRGLYANINALSRDIDIKKDADIVNLAGHFIPFTESDFDIRNSCDSIIRNRKEGTVTSDDYDTLPHKHSYLYYCDLRVRLTTATVKDQFEINKIAQRWLHDGKRDSVKHALDQYLAVCDKYGVRYKFSSEEQVKSIFSTHDFTVQRIISSSRYEHVVPYIYSSDVIETLNRIDDVRVGLTNIPALLGYIYMCLCMALVLFSFRITKLRTWFIAAIGLGLWAMLFAVVAALSYNKGEITISVLFLTLVIVFLVYAIANIMTRRHKLFAGLCFLWFTWILPGIVPFFFMFLQKAVLHEERYAYDQAGNTEYLGPDLVYQWIEDHWTYIHAANLVLVVLVIAFVLIPLARKWQANPEE